MDDLGPVLTHRLRLGERISTHTFVGLCMGALIIVGALVARYIIGIEDLDVLALVLIGFGIMIYDAAAWLSARRYRDPESSIKERKRLLRIKYGNIVLDYLALTLAIWFVGGTRSPFLPFYLLHVILSCLLLSRRSAVLFHWMAYGLLVLFVLGELSGVMPPPKMPAGAVSGSGPLQWQYAVTILVVYGVLFSLTSFLLLGLARSLRQGERELRRANEELRRLSGMQKDFLRIALHNLQSPVGVVTMFLNNLRIGLGGNISEQQSLWITRSLVRLRGVSAFMRDLQMLSTLESDKLEARASDIDVCLLLGDLVAEQQDLAKQNGHELSFECKSRIPPVRGIELLIREAIVNYITNAVKYTLSGGRIVVRARHVPPFVRVEVEDNGFGIGEEDLKRLFGEFARIHRKDKSRKREGTGLGLTIVKRVAETHGGRVGVESELGKGSTFWLELPAIEAEPESTTD